MSWATIGKISVAIFVISFILRIAASILAFVYIPKFAPPVKIDTSVFDASTTPVPEPEPEPEQSTVSVAEDNTASGFTNEFRK